MRVNATQMELYEGPHVSIADFVTSGHAGDAWQQAEHFHEAIQITILSGKNSMQANWLSDSGSKCRRRISGPAICVTPAGQPHSMEWSEAHQCLMMTVSPGLLSNEVNGGTPFSTVRERYGARDPFVQHLGAVLRQAGHLEGRISRLLAESVAVVLLEHVGARSGPPGRRRSAGCDRLPQVIEHIEDNLAAELSISTLA
jgi:hypothetical protein